MTIKHLTLVTALLLLSTACTTTKAKKDDTIPRAKLMAQMIKAHNQYLIDSETRHALHLPNADNIELPKTLPCGITGKGPNGAISERISYNGGGNLVSIIRTEGENKTSVKMSYDAQGRLTTKIYDGKYTKLRIEYAYGDEGISTRTHRSLDQQEIKLKASFYMNPEKRTITQVIWPDTPSKRKESTIVFDEQWRVIKNVDAEWTYGKGVTKDVSSMKSQVFAGTYSFTNGNILTATTTFTPIENSKYIKPRTTEQTYTHKNGKIMSSIYSITRGGVKTDTFYTYKYTCN